MDRATMGTKGSSRMCGECGGRTYLIERYGARAQAKMCKCSENCSVCSGRGYILAEREETFSRKAGARKYEVLIPCACTAMKRKVARYNAVGIPGVLAHATFENYEPNNDNQKIAKDAAQTFAHNYDKSSSNRGIVICGPVGTGKTHLLAAILAHLVLEVGVEARYVEISLLYATIRNGFREGKSGGEIIGPLADVDLLAIDELGRGRGSAFELETLDELIARRYNAGRTTLFATNFYVKEEKPRIEQRRGGISTEDLKSAARAKELLRERVNERIYSRLFQMCRFVEMPPDTDDHRQKHPADQRTHEANPRSRAMR